MLTNILLAAVLGSQLYSLWNGRGWRKIMKNIQDVQAAMDAMNKALAAETQAITDGLAAIQTENDTIAKAITALQGESPDLSSIVDQLTQAQANINTNAGNIATAKGNVVTATAQLTAAIPVAIAAVPEPTVAPTDAAAPVDVPVRTSLP